MAKIVLDTVTGGYDLSVINNNFDKIELEFQNKVLYRDNPVGEPNTLQTDVDANTKRIFNLPVPTLASEAARLQDVQNALAGGAANLITFTPYGHVAGNNVQAAVQELIDDTTNNGVALPAFLKDSNAIVVDSITALKAIDKTKFTKALVLGYYAKGDGGGGVYWYDSSDTTSVDNSGTIIVAIDSGRWKLQVTGFLSVKQFGAKLDGVSNDTSAFVAAAATGLSIFQPDGVAMITSGFTLSTNQKLIGNGPGKSKILVSGSGYSAITLAGDYASIDGMQIYSNSQRTAGAFIHLNAATRGNQIKNFVLKNGFIGIHITAESVITFISDGEILDSTATTGTGIFIDGGNDTFISNVVMDSSGTEPFSGIQIKHSQAVWISNTDIIDFGTPLLINPDGAAGDLITWCFFSQLACDTSTGAGIRIFPTNAATVRGLFFDNCWSSTNDRGVHIQTSAGAIVDTVHFTDCTFYNNQLQGVLVDNAGGNVSNIEFNNCRAAGNSLAASGVSAGIDFGNNITGFAVRGSRSGAHAGFPATQSYGILIGTGCDQYQLLDNNLIGNVTGGAVDNSAGTSTLREVRSNLGYKTSAAGSATITSGTNQVTVTHGLSGTPTVVLANPTNVNIGASSPWWTGSFGATSFSINVAANVAANSSFSWTASLYN